MMDSAIALPAGLDTVNTTNIVLPIVVLTVPGIALAMGLRRLRGPGDEADAGVPPGGGQTGKIKAALHQPVIKLASFVTILAMLAAGLGLVPLAHAIYQVVSGINKWAPTVIGIAVLALLFLKWVVVTRDLADGKVDRPWQWLTTVPLLAMLIWAAPVVFNQITNQAGQTFQEMIFGKHPAEGQGHHNDGGGPHKKNSDSDKDTDGETNPDH